MGYLPDSAAAGVLISTILALLPDICLLGRRADLGDFLGGGFSLMIDGGGGTATVLPGSSYRPFRPLSVIPGASYRPSWSLHRHWGLSPRGRGKQVSRAAVRSARRSIPAWAGETARRLAVKRMPAVYPRVGGGNAQPFPFHSGGHGLSPRGRGKPRLCQQAHQQPRSIPAWAGETKTPSPTPTSSAVYPRVGGGNNFILSPPRKVSGLSPRGRGKRHPERRFF